MSADDILEIKCPKCGKLHHYRLQVERSMIMEMFSHSNHEPHYSHFTRLFTCPEKEKDFQATFSLIETSSSPIESVEVRGLIVEKGENKK